MGILKHNNDISEINVKVDMAKIHAFLNALCNQFDNVKNKEVKRLLEGNE